MSKNKISFKNYLILLPLLVFVFSLLIILFSPYKRDQSSSYKLIKESILINTSSQSVYNYLGNSNNASTWSVYIDHISPINKSIVPD